jgi:cholesterol transport system auxiliary component
MIPSNTRRGFLISGGAILLLSACSDLVGPPPASQLYVLAPTRMPVAPGPKVTWSLSLQSPLAPDSLDGSRLPLTRGTTMDYYANAELPQRLPRLVQTALMEAFETSQRIDQISRSEEGLRSDYVLQTDIRNCEAVYDSQNAAPKILVRIAVKMVNSFDRRIVANLLAEQQVQASEDSVPAVIIAMNQAIGSAVSLIVNWALALPAPLNTRAP